VSSVRLQHFLKTTRMSGSARMTLCYITLKLGIVLVSSIFKRCMKTLINQWS